MKRIFSAILATLMLSSAAVATVSAAAKVEGRKTIEAYIATDITIDGKVEEAWNYAPEVELNVLKSNTSKEWYKDTMKAGVDYAKATAKVLWDGDKTLYILNTIVDKTPNYTAANAWDKDGIDLFLHWENTTVAGTAKSKQYRVVSDGSSVSKNAVAKISKSGDTIIMEWSVPLDTAKIGGKVAGEYIGIDFQCNDNVLGKGARECNLGWSDKEDKASSDASVYGQCLLSAKKVADVKAAQTTAATTKAPASTTAATTKAPTTKPASPATFDAGILMAVAAAASCAGVVVSKKRK